MFDARKDELIQVLKEQVDYLKSLLADRDKQILAITNPTAFSRLYPNLVRPAPEIVVHPHTPTTPSELRRTPYIQPNALKRDEIEALFESQ